MPGANENRHVTEDAARDRMARNETLIRQVNERVKDVSDVFAGLDPSPVDFVCECGNADCTEPVSLTLGEYERVRSVPTHFFVVPDHVIPGVEAIVREGDGYVIVEKVADEAHVAKETDPRSS
jgi:hypothetical protein